MATQETLFAAADLFQIGAMALDYPTEPVAEGFANGTLMTDVQACLAEMGVDGDIVAAGSESPDPKTIWEALKVEHSRLFANVRNPVIWIYETVFCRPEGEEDSAMLFVSPDCLHVEESMKRAGVELAADNRQPADYLPTELQFLSYLCNAEAEGKLEVVSTGALDGFMAMHLDRWLPAFMDALQRETVMDEYRQLAAALTAGYRCLAFARKTT
ncbi:MAG: molecular chaperone TorD family protein [Eggerthellaceae bacterium]|nr:molecular chaperone TorD family protein [Eggerthellaceae bacterium]